MTQVQYEALRDDHCVDPKGAAKSTYCNKNAGDHGRLQGGPVGGRFCFFASGKCVRKLEAGKMGCEVPELEVIDAVVSIKGK